MLLRAGCLIEGGQDPKATCLRLLAAQEVIAGCECLLSNLTMLVCHALGCRVQLVSRSCKAAVQGNVLTGDFRRQSKAVCSIADWLLVSAFHSCDWSVRALSLGCASA